MTLLKLVMDNAVISELWLWRKQNWLEILVFIPRLQFVTAVLSAEKSNMNKKNCRCKNLRKNYEEIYNNDTSRFKSFVANRLKNNTKK